MSDPAFIGYIVLILILICLSAFFSASETAFISLGSYHLQKLLKKDKRAKRLRFWFANPNKVLITTLVGNNLVNIFAAVLAAAISYRRFEKISTAVITLIMAFVILVFAEIIPKSIAKKSAGKIAIKVAIPVKILVFILTPLSAIFVFFSNAVVKIFGGRIESILPVLTEEDLKAMISAGEEEGIIEEEGREMIHSIFEFGDKMVREIMTPRVDIVSVEEETPVGEILKLIAHEGFSRLPVLKENIDEIVGIVYIKDIIAKEINEPEKSIKAKDIMRVPYFVPETKKVQELMNELQEEKLQMSIIVDEYGGTAGLITMEDLVEEIVGEIADEYKKEVSEFQELPDGRYLIKGNVEIERVNDELGLDLPEDKVDTVAGFILDHLGTFPEKGEKFQYGNYQFVIQEADDKAIKWVCLKKIVESSSEKKEKNEPGRNHSAEV